MRKLLLLVCLTPLLIKLRTFHQRKEVKTILLWNPFFEDETFGLRQNIFILKLKLSVWIISDQLSRKMFSFRSALESLAALSRGASLPMTGLNTFENWKCKLKSTKIFGKNAELSKKSKTWKLLFSIIETWTSQICQTRMKENPSNSIFILILKVLFILIQELSNFMLIHGYWVVNFYDKIFLKHLKI